jgi:hypothetical protein
LINKVLRTIGAFATGRLTGKKYGCNALSLWVLPQMQTRHRTVYQNPVFGKTGAMIIISTFPIYDHYSAMGTFNFTPAVSFIASGYPAKDNSIPCYLGWQVKD